VPDIGAAGVEAVPELAPQLPIEVSGDETLPLPSVREEKRTVSAKEKLPQKRGGHGGASGSSKKGVDQRAKRTTAHIRAQILTPWKGQWRD
jgi:hypothetical protein